jgi:hypothetical protein
MIGMLLQTSNLHLHVVFEEYREGHACERNVVVS